MNRPFKREFLQSVGQDERDGWQWPHVGEHRVTEHDAVGGGLGARG